MKQLKATSRIKLTLTVVLCLIGLRSYADSFCGVILAKNGLNVRTEPRLTSGILYKLHQGETFKFYADGYTEIYQTIQDGGENLTGQWIKIDLYTYDESGNPEEGYLFLTPAYAVEMYDCREFRHRISEAELYNHTYGEDEYAQKRKDTLQNIVKLTYEHFQQAAPASGKAIYEKDAAHYEISADTILLKLDHGKVKKIISYPLGKDGYDDAREAYEFMGYVARMHSYLIQGSYWESGDYFFVNKKTGLVSPHFEGLPSISPDNKRMLVVFEDLYEEGTNMALYEMENNQVKLSIQYIFSDWTVDGEVFWVSPDEALIPARSVRDASNWVDEAYDNSIEAEKEWAKVKKQYVKMKVR